MSTDWHIYCVDCDVAALDGGDNTSGSGWEEDMWILCRAAKGLAVVHDAISGINQAGHWLELYVPIDHSFQLARPAIDLEFFAKHASHRIVPRNEYGHLSGQCCERFNCPHCNIQHWCDLPLGHEGEHNSRRYKR